MTSPTVYCVIETPPIARTLATQLVSLLLAAGSFPEERPPELFERPALRLLTGEGGHGTEIVHLVLK